MSWEQVFFVFRVDLGACVWGFKADLYKLFLGLGTVLGASVVMDKIESFS